MALATGTRLGAFEIVAPLGAGGMGEVYRARDTKLGRSVALKLLPDAVAADPERVARFEREAKVLAALNHPNIATLYGVEESGERHLLVMELVEGPTLADILAGQTTAGAEGSRTRLRDNEAASVRVSGSSHGLGIDEALAIAKQIAAALEAAHERGIVHRDLKPANIKLTVRGAPPPRNEDGRLERRLSAADVADCTVKVLDFGLARAMDPQAVPAAAPALADISPTLSGLATQAGVILGTAAYMSPEQAKGLAADHRSDLFSFGVVLYEMLTGQPPFQGETATDVLASVVAREADLTLLPPNLNPRLVELLQRCLEKSPRRRWQTATDLRADLEAIDRSRRSSVALAPVVVQTPSRRRVVLISAASVAAGAVLTLGGVWLFRAEPAPAPRVPTTRFSLPLPEGQQFTNPGRHLITISPDGGTIVYVANSQLYLRRMGELEPRPVPGTEVWNAVTEPVFSPDGLWVAFWAQRDGTIKRIGVAGGTAITLCQAANPQGMSWDADGLVFGNPGGIFRVSPNGGQAKLLIQVNDEEVAHGPQVLSGGEAVLFTLAKGRSTNLWDQAEIVVQEVRSSQRRVVLSGGSDARYLPTGHLVYASEGVLFAERFDPVQTSLAGSGKPVIEGVRRSPRGAVLGSTGTAHFSVSATGSLVYLPGPTRTVLVGRDLAQVTRSGNVAPLKLPQDTYLNPRYAPDGTRITFDLNDGKEDTIGVYDLSGATALRRLTFTGANRFPIWSPDSTRIAYQSDREGDLGIFWQRADGSGSVERLTKAEPGTSHVPDAWSPDGRTLLFETLKDGVFSLWSLSWLERKVERFGDIESPEAIDAVFSPDGRWVAYDAGEGAETRVYVEPFPRSGARYRATNERGINPFWSPSGTELIYAPTADAFASVTFATRPSVGFGNPSTVPRGVLTGTTSGARRTYDLSPDGRHILGVIEVSGASQEVARPSIQVVMNWFDELRARVP